MILKNELRIGSYISIKNENGIFNLPVFEMCEDWVNVKDEKGGIWAIWYEEMEPIPLTKEIFLKSGFRKADDWFCDDLYGLMFQCKDRGYSLEWGEYSIVTVYTVHQLQNVYFALNGNDLDVKF
ncbi:hypothetical protein EZS27_033065 [termite gut metagenome]|uniref:Uncharacterized protein n=1 Tax=termite gut metagenome TaxID=433724 RepID=A0A5J4Q706_9ZZZZ